MVHSSSDTAFLTLEKSMPWRGEREHFSNAYHLDVVPSSDSDWSALMGVAWNLEAAFFDAQVQLETATGHTPGTPPVLVWEVDVGIAGEGGTPGNFVPAANDYSTPGDVAAWCRWLTDRKTVLGKPIYFRNYYHRAYWQGDPDTLAAAQHSALLGLASAWQTGVSANGKTFRRSGPKGGAPMNHSAGTYLTTRTLERRGKRKKSATAPGGIQIMGNELGPFFKWFLTKGITDIIDTPIVP